MRLGHGNLLVWVECVESQPDQVSLIHLRVGGHVGVEGHVCTQGSEDIAPQAIVVLAEHGGGVSRDREPRPGSHFIFQLAGRPARIAHEGAEVSQGRWILQQILEVFHVAAHVDAVEDVVRVVRPFRRPIQDQEVVALDRSSGKDPVLLAFQDGNLREDFGDIDLRRSIDDDPERSFRAVFAQQDDGLPEIRIAETGACHQKDAFAKRDIHTMILQGGAKVRQEVAATEAIRRFSAMTGAGLGAPAFPMRWETGPSQVR